MKNERLVKQQALEYCDSLDLIADSKDLIKQVIVNVYQWSVNGKNKTEIANYLTLTKKEFEELTHRYPEILGAMVKGKEFANMVLSMSMYEMALGKKTTRRQVIATQNEFDESGRKVSATPTAVWIEEEVPANVRFNAMKFLMENQVPEVYGKMNKEKDENEYAKAFVNMSDAEKKALMYIEKNEHIKTISVERKEAPIVATQEVIEDEQ